MRTIAYVTALVVASSLLLSCATPASLPPTGTPPEVVAGTASETGTAEHTAFPLSEPGPYPVGRREYGFQDPSRSGREVGIFVWYPAVLPADAPGNRPINDADPDLSGAPYPLILSSAKVGGIFGPHLASHGFVAAGVKGQDSSDLWGLWLIDYPLDILFALDQIAANPLAGLVGLVDTDHAGAIGYSFDGYTALALSGARVDPAFYAARCAEAPTMDPAPPQWWIDYICDMEVPWNEFSAHAGEAITTSDDGLWQPMTDDRIRAVMPLAPEGAWLFGERGLAAVDRPTLIVGATKDAINIYDLEAAYILEHLGTPDRTMISFVGRSHMMVYRPEPVARMRHFAAAFFGGHLQGREELAQYVSEDFVAQQDGLAWGVYEGE